MKRNKSSSTIWGYAASAQGKPLTRRTFEAPKPGEHDVRTSVTHCGVCHSDISAIDDYYEITKYPFVLGQLGLASDTFGGLYDIALCSLNV